MLKNRHCIITYRRNKLPTEKRIFLSGSRYIKNIEKGKSAEFYEIYKRTFPLDKGGFEERKHLYQLYYLLNFSHRFNGSYINLTTKLIEELLLE